MNPEKERTSAHGLGEVFFIAFCATAIILHEVIGGLTEQTIDPVKMILALLLILQSWRLYKADAS